MTSTLDRCPLGTDLVVVAAGTSPPVTRRLAELGLRRGARVQVVQHTSGGGRIVGVAGSRIALGRDLVRSVTVDPAHRTVPARASGSAPASEPSRVVGLARTSRPVDLADASGGEPGRD